ncbi:NAD(P)/FAD-dependent oxidoreductase [Prevotella sp. E2-28]|uniref:NAD(P)/FAD-dependent oxidoreductase n=1 Tax=Prevotella sp. E2-28 TaxID=2913620 RepID=UPI001EDC16FD|nr:NAD(P)/FAD-dependent oxidoreductase [Prevotella sp. E2-28]UKK53693.1 NAD(P)/FAD-dependent oxidoreductase [Prevotella sp. E2-28]
MKTAVVGGGAAGFFLAINLKEMCPQMDVTILEASHHVLAKVKISGGGRCNCTNSFEEVKDLQSVYPRGHRLLKRLFKQFNNRDAYEWFENRGVKLVTQEDQCVFPQSQDSQTIINLFLSETRRLGVTIKTGYRVSNLDELSDYDFIAITTGGMNHSSFLISHFSFSDIVAPVPSLFTFNIEDKALRDLMGTVIEASAMIPGTKMRASGPLLITHWGMSGPCILRLSSYAARLLSEHNYQMPLSVNWTQLKENEVQQELASFCRQYAQKQLPSMRPFELPQRLWNYLLEKSLQGRAHAPWGSLNQKELNRLTNILTNDTYQIAGRAPFKDEFVTCGGISLSAVNPSTLESREHPHLYFAGEVLDIDGVTGGFNFQAAWTTAYAVATAITAAQKTI